MAQKDSLMGSGSTVLFLAKRADQFACVAGDILETLGCTVVRHEIGRGEPLPASATTWSGDFIVSYLCPCLIRDDLLAAASVAAINFHPGTPEYPGTGCVNFALYEDAPTYGSTCHHMAPQADSGPVIAVNRFELTSADTVWTALMRTYVGMFEMFRQLAPLIAEKAALPISPEQWTRPAFRRHQLESLCRLNATMSDAEIRRRIRATTFPGAPGAYMDIDGRRFAFLEGR